MRLFRNNVGGLYDKTGRFVQFGLHVGSGDLIGWKTITITPDMVGQTIGVFTSVETKKARGGVTADNQLIWRDTCLKFGCIAGIVKTVEEFEELVK